MKRLIRAMPSASFIRRTSRAVLPQEVNIPGKFRLSPTNDSRQAKLNDRTRAHHAWAKARAQRNAIIARAAARLSEAIHLSLSSGITVLHTPVARRW